MAPTRVLVAFSSRSGSTAGTAEEITDVLAAAGLMVDCRPKEDVADIAAYRAVVLGSGLFVPSRASDGGGFLERHAAALRGRDVWLYCTGPIGGRRGGDADTGEPPVMAVARAVGARGVASFGATRMAPGDDPLAALAPIDRGAVRQWAWEIAAALGAGGTPAGCRRRRWHAAPAAG